MRHALQFVADACRGDDELKEEITALLKANGERTGSADSPIINLEDLFPKVPKSFSVGEVMLDRFRIVCFVGGGGMVRFMKRSTSKMGRIALKTIRPDIVSNPQIGLAVLAKAATFVSIDFHSRLSARWIPAKHRCTQRYSCTGQP